MEYRTNIKIQINKKKFYIYSVLLICSIMYILFFSNSTSPLYLTNMIGYDAGMFEFMGYGWLHGAIPYHDLYDHKGPFIFAINALGYAIGGDKRYGLVPIQVILMFVSNIYCFKILRTEFSLKKTFILQFFTLICLYFPYDGGNTTGEYVLPFIFMSYYYSYKWLCKYDKNKETKVQAKIPFMFGLVFGISLMTRLTNAVGICTLALFVCFILIKEKDYKNLLKSSIYFIIASLIIILPFVIYFHIKNLTYDLWFATLLNNFTYATGKRILLMYSPVLWGIVYGHVVIMILVTLKGIIKTRSYLNTAFFLTATTSFLSLIFLGDMALNYANVSIPFIPLYCCLYRKITINKIGFYKTISNFYICCITIATLLIILRYSKYILLNNRIFFSDQQLEKKQEIDIEYKGLFKSHAINQKDSLILINTESRLYLYNKVIPGCRFFTVQDWMAQFNKQVRNQRNIEFSRCKARYIIYQYPGKNHRKNIDPNELLNIIKKRYILKEKLNISHCMN